jgi:hypothetical protein
LWDALLRDVNEGGQLAPLVDRPEFVGLALTAEPPGANRAELEAAADALLAHSLAGRRTDAVRPGGGERLALIIRHSRAVSQAFLVMLPPP